MKNLHSFRASHKAACQFELTNQINNAKHVREPFSDSDILNLQDAFLTSGIHYIKTDDVSTGRALTTLFLNSLNCYHNIAALSMTSEPLQTKTTDLYAELILGQHLNQNLSHELEDFFLEKFYYDFMWIEATKKLLDSFWTQEFFRKITDFKLDQLIPILVVSYKKSS